jgi:hypothetical protein
LSDKRKREGGETNVINGDKGEADKTTMMGMVAIGRDTVAVANARGAAVWIQAIQWGGHGLATMREGGKDLQQNKQKDDKEVQRSVLSRRGWGRGSGLCLLTKKEVKTLPTI